MFDLRRKLKPLTEEEKSLVRNYFATWECGGMSEWHIWFNYGRMRNHGERIPSAEEYLDDYLRKMMTNYKLEKEMEILRGLQDYEDEHQEAWEYEVMKINRWDSWRTLVIWILEQNSKGITHSHAVEISEVSNPAYFSECMMRYAPWQALSTDKPF